MNLGKLWPDYFGLTNDSTFIEVRKRHYPLYGNIDLSEQKAALLTGSPVSWWTFKVKMLLSFLSYEASAFLNPNFFKNELNLIAWAQGLMQKTDWDLCSLSRLNLAQAEFLKKKFRHSCSPIRLQKIHALRLTNPDFVSFDQYLSKRGFRFRKNFRHSKNMIKKAGFYFTELNSFEELFKLYEKRSVVKDATDYSVTPAFQSYLSDLWTSLKKENRLLSVALRSNEKVIGAVMAFSFENDIQVYQIAYDPDFKHLNPGRNVLLKLIETNWGRYRLMDFMSEWDYIGHLTEDYFEYRQLQLFSKSLMGRLMTFKVAITSWRV